jgi:ParB family transcriptional regulator, chromosome partitioning protein
MATRKRPEVKPMRSVSAFLSQPAEATSEGLSQQTVPIEKITLPPKQPRRYFDPEKMAQLVRSVGELGILEPLLVRVLPGGKQELKYELLAGERRFRAAQELGLKEVPIVAREFSDREALQVALIENLQREDLNPVEETEAVMELLALDLGVEQGEVVSILNQAANAQKRGLELTENVFRQYEQIENLLKGIGRFTAQSFRSSRLPLLNLPEEILETLRQGKLEYTKARAIAQVKDESQRKKLLKQVVAKDLSLIQVREQVAQLNVVPEGEENPEVTLRARVDELLRRVKRSKVWDDPKKHRKLEKALAELEGLLG